MKLNYFSLFKKLLLRGLYSFAILLSSNELYSQQISTIGEIYDYEIGDLFHIDYFSHSSQGWYASEYNYEVIDKNFSWNNQDIIYEMDVVKRESSYLRPNWTYSYITETKTYYDVDSLVVWGMIDTVYSTEELYNGRLINVYEVNIPNNNYTISHFVVGIGHAKFYSNDYGGWNNENDLVYFKKGDEEWGTPNWLTSVTVEDVVLKQPEISLYPNPAKDRLNIVTDNVNNASVYIYTMLGNHIMTNELKSGQSSIDISLLKPGVYSLVYHTDKQKFRRKFIKE